MIESSRSCELMFEKILELIVSYKQLPSREADAAKLEFSNFLSITMKENKDLTKKLTASIPLFGSFSLIPTNLYVMKGAHNVDYNVPWSSYR